MIQLNINDIYIKKCKPVLRPLEVSEWDKLSKRPFPVKKKKDKPFFTDIAAEKYFNGLINLLTGEIKKSELGVIGSMSCKGMMLSILLHSMENEQIFDENQLTNIETYINRILYG